MKNLIFQNQMLFGNSWRATILLSLSLRKVWSMQFWSFKIVSQRFCQLIRQFQERHASSHPISSILWAWNQAPIPLFSQTLQEKFWKLFLKTIGCQREFSASTFPSQFSLGAWNQNVSGDCQIVVSASKCCRQTPALASSLLLRCNSHVCILERQWRENSMRNCFWKGVHERSQKIHVGALIVGRLLYQDFL